MLGRTWSADLVGRRLKLIEPLSQRLDTRHYMRHRDSADVGRRPRRKKIDVGNGSSDDDFARGIRMQPTANIIRTYFLRYTR